MASPNPPHPEEAAEQPSRRTHHAAPMRCLRRPDRRLEHRPATRLRPFTTLLLPNLPRMSSRCAATPPCNGRIEIMPAAFRCSAALMVLACAAALPASAQLLVRKDLSYAVAKTIAETAMASCTAQGYAVSAVVVDRAGETLVALRGDNAGPPTMENARRKAYTARSFRQSTACRSRSARTSSAAPASRARPASTSPASRPESTRSPTSSNRASTNVVALTMPRGLPALPRRVPPPRLRGNGRSQP